ncbi:hypothetical protein Syun_007094 [Stephania yunnanensis]|uniref:Pentatricopeptide repeat-containing protein n=1 Tax=Stephania yunnanensis TaxID=152371 RepID=A0AAP0KXX3_9MAGN
MGCSGICIVGCAKGASIIVVPVVGVKRAHNGRETKLFEKKLAENFDGAGIGVRRIDTKSNNLSCDVGSLPSSVKNPYQEQRRKYMGQQGLNGKAGRSVKSSKKWAYGGCLPLILEALETAEDLDEALKPWEETLSNKERSVILKEQGRWERAVEIFEWFKKKDCYELNVIHYNIMIRILGNAQKWDYLEILLREMRIKGIALVNTTYGTLIHVYNKGGLKEEALLWLERMNKAGVEPDEVTLGIVVQMYKKAGEFENADQFFKKWSSGKFIRDKFGSASNASKEVEVTSETRLLSSSYTYNILIDTYGKACQLKEASNTFALMIKEGIVPTTVTFNTMINICGNHGRMDEVASLMQMMEVLRCPPDTRTYNILISLHVKQDISTAMSCFFKMKEVGLKPDLVSYRTLLYALSIRHMIKEAEDLVREMDEGGLDIDEYTQSALTRMYVEAGMLDRSWSWFERFHVVGKMSSDCYSATIDAFGEHGHSLEAEKAFACCQERGKLTVLEFNVMIKAYGIGMRYGKACALFNTMEKYGISPDKCSYNSLVRILCSASLPNVAELYVKKMQDVGLANDCIPYCVVISNYVKLGELELAEGLFKEMIKVGVQPDIVVFGVLINAYADVGSINKAMIYVNEMRKAGFFGNSVIYSSLIKLYTKVGYLKEAQESYKLLQSSEVGANEYSSNCMIDLYSERDMVEQAEDIFVDLRRRGIANEFSYAMMLCMYKRIGRFDKAIAIARKMHELHLLTDPLSYNNVISLYVSDGRLKEALETFKDMTQSNVQPDDSTFKLLGAVLLRYGASKEAVTKLEIERRKDVQSAPQGWMAALRALLDVDKSDAQKS